MFTKVLDRTDMPPIRKYVFRDLQLNEYFKVPNGTLYVKTSEVEALRQAGVLYWEAAGFLPETKVIPYQVHVMLIERIE